MVGPEGKFGITPGKNTRQEPGSVIVSVLIITPPMPGNVIGPEMPPLLADLVALLTIPSHQSLKREDTVSSSSFSGAGSGSGAGAGAGAGVVGSVRS